MDYTNKKLDNMDDMMSRIVKQASEIQTTMQILHEKDDEKGTNQKIIDSIFHESPLPFEDYEETKISRGEGLMKLM